MKIPEQHYIGMIVSRNAGQSMDQLPLAFMTPYGEDKAFEKRKATVEQWVNQNSRGGPKIEPLVLKNEPLVGFRILGCVSRMGGHKWRIEDPRGFELEISSDNMLTLIQDGVIDNSEVLEACIWARGRSDNFLLPITSQEYQDAISSTSLTKKNVSLRDVSLGNMITLQNGTKGRYAGQLAVVHRSSSEFEEHIRYMLVEEQSKSVYAASSFKVAEINDTQKWSAEEALDAVRANIDFSKRYGNLNSASHLSCVSVLSKGMSYTTSKIKIKDEIRRGSVIFYQGKYYVMGYVGPSKCDAELIDTTLWEKESVISYSSSQSWMISRPRISFDLSALKAEGIEAYLPQWVVVAQDGFTTEFI